MSTGDAGQVGRLRAEFRSVYPDPRPDAHPGWNEPPTLTVSIHAGQPHRNLQDWANRLLAGLDVRGGSPERVLEASDAIIDPKHICLFDADGGRIVESCMRRGPDLADFAYATDERIEPPRDAPVIEEPLVYLSNLPNHWGHFLTEGTSRLWALHARDDLRGRRMLFSGPGATLQLNANIRSFLELAQFDTQRFLFIDRPTRLRRVAVPLASFSNRGQAYAAHAIWPRIVAERALRAGGPLERSDQPVYLSRSRLKVTVGRGIPNEAAFEEQLARAGVRVCHPETMTLVEQVRLFNTHRTFVGASGSAFHNTIFALEPRLVTTHILGMHSPNFYLFDGITGVRANYLDCLKPMPGVVQKYPREDFLIDVELALAYLRAQGVIGAA